MKEIPIENSRFLSEQVLTYLGNKRKLLGQIDFAIQQIKSEYKKEKYVCADLFAGSGVVSRLLKQYSSELIVNDFEYYSFVINSCYLYNKSEFEKIKSSYKTAREAVLNYAKTNPVEGIVCKNYAPKDTNNIQKDERCFYTRENAILIDSCREAIYQVVPVKLTNFFLAPLLIEASKKTNTSGVFKAF